MAEVEETDMAEAALTAELEKSSLLESEDTTSNPDRDPNGLSSARLRHLYCHAARGVGGMCAVGKLLGGGIGRGACGSPHKPDSIACAVSECIRLYTVGTSGLSMIWKKLYIKRPGHADQAMAQHVKSKSVKCKYWVPFIQAPPVRHLKARSELVKK